MATRILATTPLSHNDITSLAQLFEQAFRYHREHQADPKPTYWRHFLHDIRTVTGLSFTASLVDDGAPEMFRVYLETFLKNQSLLNADMSPAKLAIAFANIISLGSDFFRCLDHPSYYRDFLQALRGCLTHIIDDVGITPSLKVKNAINLILTQ